MDIRVMCRELVIEWMEVGEEEFLLEGIWGFYFY